MSFDAQRAQLVSWLETLHPGEPISTTSTHISILAFQGEFAYKLKRDVRYPFLDLSTPVLRLVDCEREVALNRRLAPDVYLGIEAVPATAECEADHVVVMRRMPEACRLSNLVDVLDDATASRCMSAIAHVLAEFHAAAPTGGTVDDAGRYAAYVRRWTDGIEELATTFPSARADRIADAARRYLAGREPLFDARVAASRARDGHGDLLADDIYCLDDGPRLLDCLEFDDNLRGGDVLGDIAFLAMDLERLGRPDLARTFLDAYRAESGDTWPASLAHHWIAYRAHVRAKVAALRDDTTAVEQHLAIAEEHLDRGRVRLVLVGGPPATGKSTVARALADASGWTLFRSDEVRKELAGRTSRKRTATALGADIYSRKWTRRVYAELMARARTALTMGESVILDATFTEPWERELAATVAAETASDLVSLRCSVPLPVAQGRADRRAREGNDASDADAKIAAALAQQFAPWPEAAVIPTSGPLPDALVWARASVGAW